MHQFIASLPLLLVYATQSASLVLSNMPRSNPMNQGTPQLANPADLIQSQNQTGPLTSGTDHDIGSNLFVYMMLGDPTPTQPLYELLVMAKEQVSDRAALFGPTSVVPRRKANPQLTQTTHAGLEYFIDRSRVFSPRHPALQWKEFEILTFWLYEYLWILLNHQVCAFVLFRKNSTTGMELNLAFGEIKTLETTRAVEHTTSSGPARLPAESLSQSGIDTT